MRHHPQLFATMPLGVLVMTICATLPGDAEAIDCSRVSSFNEQTICGDKKLLKNHSVQKLFFLYIP